MLTFYDLRRINVLRCEGSPGFAHSLSSWSVAEWGNATAGEVGEACNVAKKLLRIRDGVGLGQNKKTKEEYLNDLADELADAVIYLDLWAASQEINLEVALRRKFNKTSKELGYDEEL